MRASLLIVVVLFGCVKDDPVVEGKRAQPLDPKVAYFEVDAGDDPNCATCAEALDPTRRRPTVCRLSRAGKAFTSGPSSTELLNALADCACRSNCTGECQGLCSGSPATDACRACLGGKCGSTAGACTSDER
jgi:hypothetical protein